MEGFLEGCCEAKCGRAGGYTHRGIDSVVNSINFGSDDCFRCSTLSYPQVIGSDLRDHTVKELSSG